MMSKKTTRTGRQSETQKDEQKEWPVVVYMWAVGLGILGYLVVGEAIFDTKSHPIHWLSGLIAGIIGIGVGWLWYRWRGDVF